MLTILTFFFFQLQFTYGGAKMNFNNAGNTIKQIRIGKNLTQKELSDGIITRTYLSKIENELVNPSFDVIEKILFRLNMTLDEFIFVCNEKKISSKHKILNSFFSISSNHELEKIQYCIKTCTKHNLSEYDPIFEDIILICTGLLSLSQKNSIDEIPNEILHVWNKYEKIDTWYLIEIKIINCLLFLFPMFTSFSLAQRLNNELLKYNDFDKLNILQAKIFLNLSTLYLEKDLKKEASIVLEKALIYSKRENRIDLICYSSARIYMLEKDIDSYSRIKDVLFLFNLQHLANELTLEEKRYFI